MTSVPDNTDRSDVQMTSAPDNTDRSDRKSGLTAWIAIGISIISLAASSAQFVLQEQRTYENEQVSLRNSLCAIEQKLAQSLNVYRHLQLFSNGGRGIIPSYVANVREGRDGTAHQWERIQELVSINSDTRKLLEAYRPSQITKQFATESQAFIEHAADYANRVKSLPNLGRNEPPPSGVDFPPKFPGAVRDELNERNSLIANPKRRRSC